MNLVQIAALAGIAACIIFLAGLVIAAVIDNGRIKKELSAYQTGWKTWGDITNLNAGGNE